MNPTLKKPFGLTLACKIAAQALHDGVAPASTVLYNLLTLQKDSAFPKELDTQFFAISRKEHAAVDRRVVARILELLRAPQNNVAELLESHVAGEWVHKHAPKPQAAPAVKKTVSKKKNKPVQKKTEPVTPVIVIKKAKLTI